MRHETLRAFAEACHREYAHLELRTYEEKQKKKELKQEALFWNIGRGLQNIPLLQGF